MQNDFARMQFYLFVCFFFSCWMNLISDEIYATVPPSVQLFSAHWNSTSRRLNQDKMKSFDLQVHKQNMLRSVAHSPMNLPTEKEHCSIMRILWKPLIKMETNRCKYIILKTYICLFAAEKVPKWNQATIAELFVHGIEFFISHQKINYGFWTLQMANGKKIPNEKTTPLKKESF